ncbi:MAG: NAD(P)/FAD-dependent oxidoreductase, partial [Gemmatimonadetes bacterium]|nr:NAD(P)/FAD-dependent oxidoreductase [Gemmatimonadota bacterium]
SRVRVYTPSHRFVELNGDRYFFMATDTARLMRHLVKETRRSGAEVRFGERFQGVGPPGNGPPGNGPPGNGLSLRDSGVACRFLVGADGARSRVAESFGLDCNRRLLKGVEWEFEPLSSAGDCLHCFIDSKYAPGYIGWVVPGVAATQVGLAVHRHRRADMPGFIRRIDPLFGLSGKRVLEKRGGVIPIGGLLRNFHGDDVVLIGDSAGMVSPLTAGGIHNAYRFGRLAGDAITDYLESGGPHPGQVIRRAYTRPRWKHAARWGYDHLPVARALDAGLVTWGMFRRLAGAVFFYRMR